MSAEGNEREEGVRREDVRVGLRCPGRWDPGRRVSGGGSARSAAQARPGPPEPRGRPGPTVSAGPARPALSGGDPEFCRCGARGPGVRVELGLTRGGAGGGGGGGGPRGLRKRSVGAAPAGGGQRADCAGAWPAPLTAPRGRPLMRWRPVALGPAGLLALPCRLRAGRPVGA